jgi:CheY-like chemotaxis protein
MSAAKRGPGPLLSGVQVLIVDDHDDWREILRTILTYCGALVAEARSARAALKKLRGFAPDVVVTDIAMPGTDGYNLVRDIRALAARTGRRPIPTVALTGHPPEHSRQHALSAGFAEYVTKPVDPWELCRVLARVVGRRAAA